VYSLTEVKFDIFLEVGYFTSAASR